MDDTGGYEEKFKKILSDMLAQSDDMARALAEAEREFERLTRNEGEFEVPPMFRKEIIAMGQAKMSALLALDRIAEVIGLGDRRDELFQRHCDVLWPGDRRPAAGSNGGPDLIDLLQRAAGSARRREAPGTARGAPASAGREAPGRPAPAHPGTPRR